jgi:protein-tyrosine kinase
MNRIQQILSKAERDGTARRMSSDDETGLRDVPPAGSVPPTIAADSRAPSRPLPAERFADETLEPLLDDAEIGAVGFDERPATDDVTVEATLDPILVAALEPLSPAAEQYRTLRSRISQAENGTPLRVIQITSPGKNDGKTVTALNLALTMAQEFQRRVLVIDADLRQPRVHDFLGLAPGPGLVDVLTGTAALHEALIEIPEHHLTVLRAGRTYDRPAEMLGSGPMRRLIDTLRTRFDRIVIDSAPAIVADPGAIAPLVDSLLLVVRASSTTKPAISHAISALASPKLLGLVFNESGAALQGQYGASA